MNEYGNNPVIMLLPYDSCSGLELFGLRFARDLLDRGIPAVVAAPEATLLHQQCLDRKIPLWPFPVIKKYEPWSFPACLKMFKALKPRAIAAFRTQMMYPVHFAKLMTGQKTPFYLFYRLGVGNLYRNDPIHRRLFKHLAGIIPNADYLKNKMHRFWGVDPEKIVCIKSGVDTKRYRPDEERRKKFRKEIGVSDDAFLIGNTGRIHPEKGSEILLRTLFDDQGPARNRKDVHLVYIGREYKPGYIDHLKKVAQDLGVDNRFHIAPFRNDVETLYSALDLFAFAVTSNEAYAYVVLESMASAVTPLIPYTGGMTEMYDHGVEGFFFEHKNTDSLRSVLTEALALPKDKLAEMGAKARERIIKNASWEKMMQVYLDHFQKMGVKLD